MSVDGQLAFRLRDMSNDNLTEKGEALTFW